MHDDRVFYIVRDPADAGFSKENNVQYITRKSLKRRFPDTADAILENGNLLILHPQTHPAYARKLLRARDFYTAMKEESIAEFMEVLTALGAKRLERETYERSQTVSQQNAKGEVSTPVFSAAGKVRMSSDSDSFQSHKVKQVLSTSMNLDVDELAKLIEGMVYNRDNFDLNRFINLKKRNAQFDSITLEWKYTVSRNETLEASIQAAFGFLFKVETKINFEEQYSENNERSVKFFASFN